mmetsp:Transcript_82531/g.266098  ORF Transcript_82531/g.266098 Transcript_82531/m.266098 type:complete len:928 (+) Transcript_82531:150-2933(+)
MSGGTQQEQHEFAFRELPGVVGPPTPRLPPIAMPPTTAPCELKLVSAECAPERAWGDDVSFTELLRILGAAHLREVRALQSQVDHLLAASGTATTNTRCTAPPPLMPSSHPAALPAVAWGLETPDLARSPVLATDSAVDVTRNDSAGHLTQKTLRKSARVTPASDANCCSMLPSMLASDAMLTTPQAYFQQNSIASATDVPPEFNQAPVCVIITSARDLRNADWSLTDGKSDPYVLVEFPGKPQFSYRTKVIQDTLDPVWNHKFVMSGFGESDSIIFSVMDEDYGKDELLGRCKLEASQLEGGFEGELELEEAGEGIRSFLRVNVKLVRGPGVKIGESGASEELWPEWMALPKCARTSNTLGSSTSRSIAQHAFDDAGKIKEANMNYTDSKRQRNRTMMHPETSLRLVWDFCGLVVLLTDLIWLPMQVFEPPQNDWTQGYAWMTLVYWTMDIALTCSTGFYSEDGHLFMSRRQVIIKYARTWMPLDVPLVTMDWYLIVSDLVASASVDRSVGMARSAKLARMTRVIRLLRLMRLAKLRKLLFTMQSYIESEFITVIVAVIKNLGLILAMNHMLACMWYWVGTWESGGWVVKQQLEEEDFGVQYLVALHWSLSQFTPGNSPVSAQTVSERIFAVCVLALAMIVATCFVSSVTSTMASVWELNRHNITQHVLLKKFLHQRHVSRTLASRITRYVEFILELRHKHVHSSRVQFLSLLSGPLHIELQTELFEPNLSMYPCFQQLASISKPNMRELCATACSNELYAKNDTVFHKEGEAKKMQFLIMGSLVYRYKSNVHHSKPKTVRVEQGQWFLEPVLWMPWKHIGEMKALTEVDTVTVSAAKFRDVLQSSLDVFLVARGFAYSFWQEFQEAKRDAGDTGNVGLTDIMIKATDTSVGGRLMGAQRSSMRNGNLDELTLCEDVQAHIVQWDD